MRARAKHAATEGLDTLRHSPVEVVSSMVIFLVIAAALYTRSPATNFIFDEQEALVNNPYVRDAAASPHKFGWLDAFTTDFWGRKPEGTIGSYRPLPNLIWRFLWWCGARGNPFIHHWVNVAVHALNSSLLASLIWRYSERRDVAWLGGLFFCMAAVSTECIAGVVGLSDVLAVTGFLLALHALRAPAKWMPFAVFGATLTSLLAKESGLSMVPLVPLAALLLSRGFHPRMPRTFLRVVLSAIAVTAAFVLYVEGRRRLFPVPLPEEFSSEAVAGKGFGARAVAGFMRWYAQPSLPKDIENNPLAFAPRSLRIAGALRVYVRNLAQVLFPWTLSGDYSYPQEPAPTTAFFPESILGAIALVAPVVFAAVLGAQSFLRARAFGAPRETRPSKPPAQAKGQSPSGRPLVAFQFDDLDDRTRLTVDRFQRRDLRPLLAVAWLCIVLFYFPVSNIPIALPTVRAERFLYPCLVGTSILLAAWSALFLRHAAQVSSASKLPYGASTWARLRAVATPARLLIVAFFLIQGVSARRHANDYTSDLTFWQATAQAAPNSAKAHLNYSVMLGGRQRNDERIAENKVALDLAPEWAMAQVYMGDILCRTQRPNEAVPYYLRGFKLGPNDKPLLVLGLQCLWDEKLFSVTSPVRATLVQDAEASQKDGANTWYNWLVSDMVLNGETNKGVDPKSRPGAPADAP